jgi:hypothetical protein
MLRQLCNSSLKFGIGRDKKRFQTGNKRMEPGIIGLVSC